MKTPSDPNIQAAAHETKDTVSTNSDKHRPICPHCGEAMDRLGMTSAPGIVIFSCPSCDRFLSASLVASDVLREALKLWLIWQGLDAPKALAIVDRSQILKRGSTLYVKADAEVVLTGD
jgi:hypothetical protein